jgi:hypothetical protein
MMLLMILIKNSNYIISDIIINHIFIYLYNKSERRNISE